MSIWGNFKIKDHCRDSGCSVVKLVNNFISSSYYDAGRGCAVEPDENGYYHFSLCEPAHDITITLKELIKESKQRFPRSNIEIEVLKLTIY